MISRQVERAEGRRELKAADRRAKTKARQERQLMVEKRRTTPSTLRIKAMSAVSRVSMSMKKSKTKDA